MAENRSLHPRRPRQQRQLGRRHRAALVVVGVQTQADFIEVREFPAEKLDHVRILVGRTALDGGRQIENQHVRRGGPPDFLDRTADLHHEIEVAVGKLLRRKFIGDLAPQPFSLDRLLDHPRTVDGHLLDLLTVVVEHETAVQVGGGHITVRDRVLHAAQRFDRPVDQVPAGLGEH